MPELLEAHQSLVVYKRLKIGRYQLHKHLTQIIRKIMQMKRLNVDEKEAYSPLPG